MGLPGVISPDLRGGASLAVVGQGWHLRRLDSDPKHDLTLNGGFLVREMVPGSFREI